MAHNRDSYTITDQWKLEVKISTSFWCDDGEPPAYSILTIATGMSHVQIDCSLRDLQELAHFFMMRKAALENFQEALEGHQQ